MNKELSLLTLIRLDTELENCLGNMEDCQRKQDFTGFLTYEQELNKIMQEIQNLGGKE